MTVTVLYSFPSSRKDSPWLYINTVNILILILSHLAFSKKLLQERLPACTVKPIKWKKSVRSCAVTAFELREVMCVMKLEVTLYSWGRSFTHSEWIQHDHKIQFYNCYGCDDISKTSVQSWASVCFPFLYINGKGEVFFSFVCKWGSCMIQTFSHLFHSWIINETWKNNLPG